MGNNARTAGILSIVAGAFGILSMGGMIFGVFMIQAMFREPFFPHEATPPEEFFSLMIGFYVAMGVFFALIGIFAIIGGVFAIKRSNWGLALAGSIAGLLTFFPCGIAAVILVSIGKEEFDRPDTLMSPG